MTNYEYIRRHLKPRVIVKYYKKAVYCEDCPCVKVCKNKARCELYLLNWLRQENTEEIEL